MAKMTKSQARKRLKEAKAKVKSVYTKYDERREGYSAGTGVTTADMAAIEKIIDKCLKRLS